MKKLQLNTAQFKAEINRCLNCPQQPCAKACPVGCNPHNFIALAKSGQINSAADSIAQANPLAQTCGLICPQKFCMQACTRANLDFAVNIPKVQAYIMQHRSSIPPQDGCSANGHKIAVIGAGPAGIAATAELLKQNFAVTLFEAENTVGGALNLIPDSRLPHQVIDEDWQTIANHPLLKVCFSHPIANPEQLLADGFEAVIFAGGEPQCINLGIEGEELAVSFLDYLKNPSHYTSAQRVAVIGGGAVAADCALTARELGAEWVEMFIRRRVCDMRISNSEKNMLLDRQIDLTGMTGVSKLSSEQNKITLHTCRNRFVDGRLTAETDNLIRRNNFDLVIKAIGCRAEHLSSSNHIYYAGDCSTGSSTAVEAIASGKAVAQRIIANFLL